MSSPANNKLQQKEMISNNKQMVESRAFFRFDLLVKHDQAAQKIGNSGVRHRDT